MMLHAAGGICAGPFSVQHKTRDCSTKYNIMKAVFASMALSATAGELMGAVKGLTDV